MEYEIFIWNAVLVINLLRVLLFSFQSFICALRLTTVIMQAPHALIVCKCDDNLFERKNF